MNTNKIRVKTAHLLCLAALMLQPAFGLVAQAQDYGPPPVGYDPNSSPGYDNGYQPNSPFMGSDSPSFGGGGYNPEAYQTSYGYPQADTNWTSTAVQGFKFSYSPQAGDYFSDQTQNTGRWEQFPITMHLTFPDEMSEAQQKAIKAGVKLWQKYVNITLVDRPDKARIEVKWVSELDDDSDLGETEYTKTHVDGMGRTVIDKAVIKMLDPENYEGVNEGVVKSAVMHQIGHALGINAHSDNYRDLMAEQSYHKVSKDLVKKTVRSIAKKTLIGQLIDLPGGDEDAKSGKKKQTPIVEKISKRDLNTLYRLYN